MNDDLLSLMNEMIEDLKIHLIALCLDCGYTLTEFQFGYDEMFSKEDFEIENCRCGEVKLKGGSCNNREYHRGDEDGRKDYY